MTTITIPKKTTRNGELIAIPRKEYEAYLELRKIVPVVKMTPAERRSWKTAERDYAEGKYVTLAELERELDITHKRRG